MKRIFLDIGGWKGDTSKIVLNEIYSFDEIHCFEPVKSNYRRIERTLKSDRLFVHKYGLLDKKCERMIYSAGTIGGSIYREKRMKEVKPPALCYFVRASEWFASNLNHEDYIVGKINVEGAEISILNDLIDSNEFFKVNHWLIHLDIGKVKGMEHLSKEMGNKFKRYDITNYTTPDEIKSLMTGKKNHKNVIRKWLEREEIFE